MKSLTIFNISNLEDLIKAYFECDETIKKLHSELSAGSNNLAITEKLISEIQIKEIVHAL